MVEYLKKDDCVEEGYLSDWYISSVSENDSPVWTEAHIEELCNDFYLIPKSTSAADVQPVKRGEWDGYVCSECNECADYFISGDFYFDEKPNFCPNCGARMDGDT